jgi:hypothetical protein
MHFKFHESPSSCSQFFLANGQMDRRTDGLKDRHDKLIVAFRNFAKAPKIATACGIRKIQKLGKRYARISV